MTSHPPSPRNTSSTLKDLLLLFGIPVAVIVLAIGIVYLPRLFAHPGYDFIYSSCADYSCNGSFTVDSAGTVSATPSASRYYDQYPARTLYYYDIATDTSRQIDIAEARAYHLVGTTTSPDGYQLERSAHDGGFFFWGSTARTDAWYLADGAKKRHVTITSENRSNQIDLVGWVAK